MMILLLLLLLLMFLCCNKTKDVTVDHAVLCRRLHHRLIVVFMERVASLSSNIDDVVGVVAVTTVLLDADVVGYVVVDLLV